MAEGDTPYVIDDRRIYNIEERSDFDPHQRVHADQLGTDWGDGFFVQEEPVLVTRNRDGSIRSLRNLSDIPGFLEVDEDAEPVEGAPVEKLNPLSLSQRQKLVSILAMRLFKWYKSQPPSITQYNPIYDGIPVAPTGSAENLSPLPGTNLYPASESQVMDWLKRDVIGPRAQLINKQRKLTGYAQDYALRLSRDVVS